MDKRQIVKSRIKRRRKRCLIQVYTIVTHPLYKCLQSLDIIICQFVILPFKSMHFYSFLKKKKILYQPFKKNNETKAKRKKMQYSNKFDGFYPLSYRAVTI